LVKDKVIPVTYNKTSLFLSRLNSEGVIEFLQRENGHTQLFDFIDKREGKGIFIDEKGEVYRA
jgi:hypothetical protein